MKVALGVIFSGLLLIPFASAAPRHDPLTSAEIDQLRDTAQEPEQRLKLYIKFARARLTSLEQVRSDPKVTDRGQETHDRLQDFLDLYDELNDNCSANRKKQPSTRRKQNLNRKESFRFLEYDPC